MKSKRSSVRPSGHGAWGEHNTWFRAKKVLDRDERRVFVLRAGWGGEGGRGGEDAMVGSKLSPPMIITRVLMVRALVFSKCVDFVPLLRRPGFQLL